MLLTQFKAGPKKMALWINTALTSTKTLYRCHAAHFKWTLSRALPSLRANAANEDIAHQA